MTTEQSFKQAADYQRQSGSPSFVPDDWPSEWIAILIQLYTEQPLPVDKLPYTKMFDELVKLLNFKTGGGYHPHTVFGMLMTLRKMERLTLKGK